MLGYDALYRLNAVTYPNADTQGYTYDPMGNRLTKVNNSVTTNYTNDDADQMTAAGGVAYGYDNNGNQTSRGADTFSYNAENRLTATNLTGTAGSYAYNGDGLRTSRTIGATTTTFAWGAATGMPVILRDSAGNRYLYGLDLISVSDSANTKTYYHTDGLGSTTAITSSAGAVVKTYQYDVFGAVRAQTGTQPNEFTFTGEQNDSSGLEYLRARYYDSATGRFVGRDPLPFAQRYAYAGGNPANFTDPSGLWCPGCDKLASAAKGIGRAGSAIADPANLGYIDIGGTVCVGICFTAGIQASFGEGLHGYVGGGIGTPQFDATVTVAPFQHITTGWNCGVAAYGGVGLAGVGGQYGAGGVGKRPSATSSSVNDKEGPKAQPSHNPGWDFAQSRFGELGVSVGPSWPLSVSATCSYIF